MAHYLIVTEPEPDYFAYDVEHEKDCPTYGIFFDPQGGSVGDYSCGVGYNVNNCGFDDLLDTQDIRMKTLNISVYIFGAIFKPFLSHPIP